MTPTGRILLPFFLAWVAFIFIAEFTVTTVLKVGTEIANMLCRAGEEN